MIFDQNKKELLDKLIRLYYMMIPNDFCCLKPEKIFI